MQLAGIKILTATSAERVKTMLQSMDGSQCLQYACSLDDDLPVILITRQGDVPLAVEAMRSRAHDFIEKLFSPKHLLGVVKRTPQKRQLTLEVESLRHSKILPASTTLVNCHRRAPRPNTLMS